MRGKISWWTNGPTDAADPGDTLLINENGLMKFKEEDDWLLI